MDSRTDQRRRRSICLAEYDYTHPGAYSVTICAQDRKLLFGKVIDGEMVLSGWGEIVRAVWDEIPAHFPNVESDILVIMPNHLHGIIIITDAVGAGSPGPPSGAATAPLRRPTLGQIVAYFEYQSTKRINQQRSTPGIRIWQRNYFEHVVRNERTFDAIRRYIENNPLGWELDRYNPAVSGPDPDARALWELLKADPPPGRNRP
ncbi:MAG: transposase [Anaerolineae bacterium]|nr:transposase [Anaerolineae bacterium]